jgi:hypothetical protein
MAVSGHCSKPRPKVQLYAPGYARGSVALSPPKRAPFVSQSDRSIAHRPPKPPVTQADADGDLLSRLWLSFLEETNEELLIAEERQRANLKASTDLEPQARLHTRSPAQQPTIVRPPTRRSSMAVASQYGSLLLPPVSANHLAISPMSAPLPHREGWFQEQQAQIFEQQSDRHQSCCGWISDPAEPEFDWAGIDVGADSGASDEDVVEFGWAS